MESSCKNNIGKVKLKGDSMVISVVACGICNRCTQKMTEVKIIAIRKSEDAIEST